MSRSNSRSLGEEWLVLVTASYTSPSLIIYQEVKFVSRSNSRALGEERLVLVTASYVPFAIFSTIPYQKPQRSTRSVGSQCKGVLAKEKFAEGGGGSTPLALAIKMQV